MRSFLSLLGKSGQLLFAVVIVLLYVSVVLPAGVAAGTFETLAAVVGLWLLMCALFVWIRYMATSNTEQHTHEET